MVGILITRAASVGYPHDAVLRHELCKRAVRGFIEEVISLAGSTTMTAVDPIRRADLSHVLTFQSSRNRIRRSPCLPRMMAFPRVHDCGKSAPVTGVNRAVVGRHWRKRKASFTCKPNHRHLLLLPALRLSSLLADAGLAFLTLQRPAANCPNEGVVKNVLAGNFNPRDADILGFLFGDAMRDHDLHASGRSLTSQESHIDDASAGKAVLDGSLDDLLRYGLLQVA